MKRAIYILAAIIFAGINCTLAAQQKNSYLDLNYDKINHTDGVTPVRLANLKGDIEQMTQIAYETTEGKKKWINGTPHFTFIFRKNKTVYEEISYYDERRIDYRIIYDNYLKNKVKKRIYLNRDQTVREEEINYFDDNDLCIEEVSKIRDSIYVEKLQTIKLKRDTILYKGKHGDEYYLKKQLVKRVDRNQTSLYEYKLGKVSKITKFYGKNKTIETFNKSLDLINYQLFDENGKLASDRTYTYDAKGRRISYKNVLPLEGSFSETTYEYDDQNRLVKFKETANSDYVLEEYTYEYDEHGNLIAKVGFPYPETHEYKYDEMGNWIERNSTIGDNYKELVIREFEYYK